MGWPKLYFHVKKGTRIACVSDCDHYRKLARTLPTAEQTVLEIGCSFGEATQWLSQAANKVVAIDTSHTTIAACQERWGDLSNTTFHAIDGRDLEAISNLCPDPDWIFIDIGGDASFVNLSALLRLYLTHFHTQNWVVRNYEWAIMQQLTCQTSLPEENHRVRDQLKNPNDALDALLELSQSPTSSDRLFAVRKLRRLSHPKAWARLHELKQDPNTKIRHICQNLPATGEHQ